MYAIAPEHAYWFGMGVAASVGLGAGYHSGILHLFPMVAERAASTHVPS